MVAVVDTSVTDAGLRAMHEAGVRGIRFNIVNPSVTTWEMVEPLSAAWRRWAGTRSSTSPQGRSTSTPRCSAACRRRSCSTTSPMWSCRITSARLDLLTEWVPDTAQGARILVANPAQLYDFPVG